LHHSRVIAGESGRSSNLIRQGLLDAPLSPKSAKADFGSYQASEIGNIDFAGHDKTVIHSITDES